MRATRRAYDPDSDFIRIRDFLVETFTLYQRPFNWLLERWNSCRYMVIPIHSYYNTRYFGVPTRPHLRFRDELPFWESTIAVWENERGNIVAVVHSENEEPGEAWFQIHPDYTELYAEMLAYAEGHLADRVDDLGFLKAYVNDGCELAEAARARGYRRLSQYCTHHLEYVLPDDLPAPELPEGFEIRSVLEEDDVDKRRMLKAIAFGGGYAPSDWVPASAYLEIQGAPDYRSDLDLFVVAPGGDYAAFCTAWVDEKNKFGKFEPVGTHAEYRGLGLGRALLLAGFERMARYGISRSFMDSGHEFYRKIGYKETPYSYSPWIRYFPV